MFVGFVKWRFLLCFQCGLLWVLSVALPAELMVKVGEKQSPSRDISERAARPRTLILTGSDRWKDDHHSFLTALEGHSIDWSSLSEGSEAIQLAEDDAPIYHNLIVADGDLVRGKKAKRLVDKLFQSMEAHDINLVILGHRGTESGVADLLLHKLDLTSTDKQSEVKDYFANLHNDPSMVLSDQVLPLKGVLSSPVLESTYLHRGQAQVLPKSNALPMGFLLGNPTTVSGLLSGSSLSLITLIQTRTNARMVVIGSPDFCSDQFVQLNRPNLGACAELIDWTAQRRGIVDWANISHRKAGGTTQSMYRIKDNLEFQIDVMELADLHSFPDAKSESLWHPFHQVEGIQLEFTMLDPHWRLFLNSTSPSAVPEELPSWTDATAGAQFEAPDRCGIFKLVVYFTQRGYSFLHLETLVPLRNFRHDDYERFIWAASPYYASTFVSLALVAVFSVLFLHSVPKPHAE